MPSILDNKHVYAISIDSKQIKEVENFLSSTIGPRLYFLHRQRGGKNWCIKNSGNTLSVEVDDEHMATFIRLKFT